MKACPSDDELLAYALGTLTEAEADALDPHVADCDVCRPVLGEAARALAGDQTPAEDEPREPPPLLQPGARIGRYVVLELLGAGGVGVVYAAYDPELDRRVAVKVLRPERRAGASAQALQHHLLREGKAMARLAHPNVVAVHDVGVVDGGDGGVFLAMELIEGQTLRAWVSAAARPWHAVLDAYLQAGRGLAAAHRAGLVHRDFKPDNVLVGRDGRIRVTDFGLARIDGAIEPPRLAVSDEMSLTMTMSGVVVGTPPYMAPEQLRGEPAGVAADIFAFCASLYQALFGRHPFPTESLTALRDAVLRGEVREPPASPAVPARVRRALKHGLLPDPAARPRDMDALLDALSTHRRRAASLVLLIGPVVLAIAVGALAARDRAPSPCLAGAARLGEVWNPARARAVSAAFAATGAPYAATVGARAAGVLDDYGASWSAGYRGACEATHVRGEQSAELLDRRMICLDARLREMSATVATFERASRAVLDKAPEAALALEPVADCADRGRLLAQAHPPRDPGARGRLDAAGEPVAKVRALRRAGSYGAALGEAALATGAALVAGHAPLVGDAFYEKGLTESALGKLAPARASFESAMGAAVRGGDETLAVKSQIELIKVLVLEAKGDEALRWADLAASHVERLGDDPILRASLLGTRAMLLTRTDRPLAALPFMAAAVGLLQARLGTDHPLVAAAMTGMVNVLLYNSRMADALVWSDRALAVYQRLYGPGHPETFAASAARANVLRSLARRREALAAIKDAIAVRDRAGDPNQVGLGKALLTEAHIELSLGLGAEAVAALERALAFSRAALGPDHPDQMSLYNILCLARSRGGRPEAETMEACDKALELAERHTGKESTRTAFALWCHGVALEVYGRYARSCPMFDRAAGLLAKLGPHFVDLAIMRESQGTCAMRQHRDADAQALLEEALSIKENAAGRDEMNVAVTRIILSRLAVQRGAGARAVELAEGALGVFEKLEIDPILVADAQVALSQALQAARRDEPRARELAATGGRAVLASPYADVETRERARVAMRPFKLP